MQSAIKIVEEYWQRMASNDFASITELLADDFYVDWPQSNERIVGAAKYVQMNQEYPAHGTWQFSIHRLFGNDVTGEVVSEVAITDGVQHPLAISFFTVQHGKISRLVEYWPEPAAAQSNRAHLTQAIK